MLHTNLHLCNYTQRHFLQQFFSQHPLPSFLINPFGDEPVRLRLSNLPIQKIASAHLSFYTPYD